jgi:AcrR family transcriptional regulator
MVNTVHYIGFTKGFSLGVKERQEREREAVARSILDAARDLFVAEGYLNVSIRKIADRIEYSPAAIYSYFPSKDDIFFALAEEGFRLLFSSADLDREPGADGLNAVRAPFWHLYQFSRRHPEYFALMFVDRSVPRISKNWDRFSFVGTMKGQIADVIRRAIETGHLPHGTDPHAVMRVLMVAMIGASVMQLCGRMEAGENPDTLARATLDAALAGIGHGSLLGINAGPCVDPAQGQ